MAAPARKQKTGSLLDLPARQWFKTYAQINTKMVLTEQKNQASAMAISVPWPKPVGWAEQESAQERT